ncbi:MAG: DUF1559 domain-containing protein [Phycisphaerales bacterium]|nr:DUF1559 domain-containing protein [Phycisphaerales bacterium]
MGLLMAILLPTLGRAYETARRVQCASNQRQIGLALHMYADNHGGVLPPTVFGTGATILDQDPHEMVYLRLDHHPRVGNEVAWDGLGLLLELEYLTHPGVFYCPSHHSFHTYDDFKDEFQSGQGSIAGNFLYRYDARVGKGYLSDLPSEMALLADSFRSKPDYNHQVGMNSMLADGSVHWFEDVGQRLYNVVPYSESSPTSRTIVRRMWGWLDYGHIPTIVDYVPLPPDN